MLTRIDRVQVVAAEASRAAAAYQRLLHAEIERRDAVHALAARRIVLRLGTSEVEVLEPDGAGIVADFLADTGGGLFAAGVATRDIDKLRKHIEESRGTAVEEGGQLHLSDDTVGVPGLRAVVSAESDREPVGLVRGLYEVTSLVREVAPAVRQAASTFRLDPGAFVPIRSEPYGYEGILTLFHDDRLDRLEIITPTDSTKSMGRFFERHGPSLYMCYAEAEDLAPIRAKLLDYAPTDWTGSRDEPRPDNLFIHPKALGGTMIGLSRATTAWVWSGHPERVVR